jgi:hypothetical protein
MDSHFRGNDTTNKYVTLRAVAGSIAQNNKDRFCTVAPNDKVLRYKIIILFLLLPLKRASGVYGESILRICEFQHVAR